MKTLTVGVCSYQRRDSIVRLVDGLNALARCQPTAWEGVDVVVVLDGSTDGSREALDALDSALPLQVHWQANAGLASARNACLARATGQIVWFLDDDLVPAAGAIDLHRRIHEEQDRVVVVGPCLIPEDMEVPAGVRQWWRDRYDELAAIEGRPRFDQFFVANSTIPRELLHAVGGFDERFSGYGWEDFELGVRVLAADVRFTYEPRAISWHYTETDDHLAFDRQRVIGRTTAEMFRIHPELAEEYFPKEYPRKLIEVMDRLRLHSPVVLWAVAKVAFFLMGPAERALGTRVRVLRSLAWEAAFYCGIAERDPKALPRAMGRPMTKVAVPA
jgi:GT2 family glycosyltransferase